MNRAVIETIRDKYQDLATKWSGGIVAGHKAAAVQEVLDALAAQPEAEGDTNLPSDAGHVAGAQIMLSDALDAVYIGFRDLSSRQVVGLREALRGLPTVTQHREVEDALALLIQYARWQVSEGQSHHPTLPSAVAKATAALNAMGHLVSGQPGYPEQLAARLGIKRPAPPPQTRPAGEPTLAMLKAGYEALRKLYPPKQNGGEAIGQYAVWEAMYAAQSSQESQSELLEQFNAARFQRDELAQDYSDLQTQVAEMTAALQAHDAYMLDAGYEGPESTALHPKAAKNWRTVRRILESLKQ